MSHFVVLLRGVNVGRGNRVPMAGFRALLESLGFSAVKTVLNSGNAVFAGPARSSGALARTIRAELHSSLGLDVPVIVKSAAEFTAVVEGNVLAGACQDASRLLVAFAQDPAVVQGLAGVATLVRSPEQFAVGTHAAYLSCPNGILESQAAVVLLGMGGAGITTRNWATVQKLHALLAP